MPKLFLFAPCERVIISQEGPLSLITLIEGLNASFPEEEYANLSDDAVSQITWHIVVKWSREFDENEEPGHWQQRVQVSTPNGRVSTDITTDIDLVKNLGIRSIVRVNGFPVKPLGICKITLSLRKAGDEDAAWEEIATFPVKIQNIPPKVEK